LDSLIETVPKIANFPFYPRKLDEKGIFMTCQSEYVMIIY